ncbi:unnamed protein product [Paramecium pentaurelia]|uniref:Uncharacterized protein n=1 Tax=Paramecium pentaurelia TaxID=43138 RepID=A0A8S1VDN5_9CILI|nr:unnamed protein product [Paramecium pentaurelia]
MHIKNYIMKSKSKIKKANILYVILKYISRVNMINQIKNFKLVKISQIWQIFIHLYSLSINRCHNRTSKIYIEILNLQIYIFLVKITISNLEILGENSKFCKTQAEQFYQLTPEQINETHFFESIIIWT